MLLVVLSYCKPQTTERESLGMRLILGWTFTADLFVMGHKYVPPMVKGLNKTLSHYTAIMICSTRVEQLLIAKYLSTRNLAK